MTPFFTRLIRLFFFFFLVFSLPAIAKVKLTAIDCSADQYTARINEVNLGPDQFIEIYFTDYITTSDWDICYSKKKGSEVCSSDSTRVPANNSYSPDEFVVFTLPSDMDKKKGEILIKDGNGDAIDSLTYCNGGSCTNALWDFNASCTTTFTNHAPDQTDLYRTTDGTGVFDNNKTTTEGVSNTGPADDTAGQSSCGLIPATYPLYSGTEIKIEKDITINNGTNINTIFSGTYKLGAAISSYGTISTGVTLSLPSLDPSSFPSNNSNNNLQVTTTSTITDTSFKKIEITSDNITVNFTGGGPFFIDELIIKSSGVTLSFAAGTYYINKFRLEKDNPTINISTPSVIFHIGTEFIIEGKNTNINAGGNVNDFLIYLHSGAKFESKKENLNFTGLIYGPDEIDKVKIEGANSTFKGAAIISDGKLEIKKENISFIYTAEDQTAIGNISTCSGGGGGGDTAAAIFNCVENGADGISGKLYTKTTAQSFSFDVVALRDASTIETDFSSGADHTVTVELVNAETVGSCDSYPTLSPAVSQSLTMLSSDSGIKASAAMSSNTAYKAVKCRVTDATDNPSVIGCSTDSFAIRPTLFSITSSQTNSASTGLPIVKSGENFTLTATAISGYTGTPVINNANIEAHAGAIQTGAVSGSFNAAISGPGTATGTTFTYSEVGSLRFTAQGIYDNNFTTIDQNDDCTDDFSNTVDGNGKVGCKFGNTASTNYFGRFTPDHFVLSNKNLEDRINLSCSSDSIFTYIGETFQTSFTLTAENNSNNTTQNYTGSFAKLIGSDFNFGAIDLADAIAPISATALSSQLSLVSTSGSWTNGIANMTAILGVSRTSLEGPFESFNLGIAPTDSDGITVSSYNLDTSVPSDSNDRELLATTKIRFGRLNIENSHGSELLPLAVPVYTEYYNGTSFVINTDDTCTPISIPQLSFNGGTNPITVGSGTSTASIANSPLTLGKAGVSLSAPGANNTGFVDINSDIFISSFPWLGYDWDGDGSHDNSASARATFGIYKGNSQQIYFREVY